MSAAASTAEEPRVLHDTAKKLVHMANQISQFFASQGKEDAAVVGTADHIKSFWTPQMRNRIFAHLDSAGGEGLDPVALKAVRMLREAAPRTVRA